MRPEKDHRSFLRSGNSLVEYVLPVGVIGFILIVALTQIVPEFRSALNGWMNGYESTTGDKSQLNIKAYGNNPYLRTAQLTLADGTTISLENYPGDLNAMVETVGIDGTTSALAQLLKSLADKLLAEGKITPDQANLLSNLANRGFDLGKTESILESLAQNANGDRENFIAATTDLGGENLNITELYRRLGGHDLANIGPDSILLSPSDLDNSEYLFPGYNETYGSRVYTGEQQYQMLQAFGEARSSGALSDPAVNQLVTALTRRIISVAQYTASASDHIAKGTAETGQLQEVVSSILTEKDSTSICSAGGTTAVDNVCPKIN